MRVFVFTLGTLGDFELFLTLALALRRRGHDVVLGASPFYCARARDAGLGYAAIGDGTRDELIAVLRSLAHVPDRHARTLEFFARWIQRQLGAGMDSVRRVAAHSDYVVNNLKVLLWRGERVIPGAVVTYDPPASLDDFRTYGTHEQGGRILDLVAMPKALLDPDDRWPPWLAFTGFWFAREAVSRQPSRRLADFLTDGRPPVVLTMGSMVTLDPARLAAQVTEAMRRAGQRGVIVNGWSGIPAGTDQSGTVLAIEHAPYEWLFPRAACVIHHGGTGTVAAVLRAGRPSILLPQITCQEHFARTLVDADVAAGVFDTGTLDVGALATAIDHAVSDDRLAKSLRHWQDVVARDEGVDGAVERIEAHAAECVGDAP